ncbi:glycosyl hydrolase [Cellulomonas sp. PhB143]|uniref:glycosyl hydrolase n=1 Tax=Cellulomonas sp. PhB143 TaxID=2485186 RepID=UPI000F4AAE6D|nr:glycosyl hydrolase [Cellulomonas sp. PhB143]ROS78927.1 endoglucanase Acf2 [Cellulomonas sp. PhB143]
MTAGPRGRAARPAARRRAGAALVALVALVAGLGGGCSVLGGTGPPGATSAPGAAPAPTRAGVAPDVGAALADLPQESLAPAPTLRVADGLVPPTNRWFSGLAIGDEPQPVFATPLSFAATADGFTFGVPDVTTGPTTITGALAPDVAVGLGAASFAVGADDAASVTLIFLADDGARLGTLVLAEGSPLVSYTAAADGEVQVPGFAPSSGAGGSGSTRAAGTSGRQVLGATLGDRGYLLAAPDGAQVADGRVTLEAGQSLVWGALPDGASVADPGTGGAALLDAMRRPVTGTDVRYGAGTSAVSTAVRYRTSGAGTGTVVVRLPHQETAARGAEAPRCGLGSYATVLGTAELCTASTLAWSAPAVAPSGRLDLSGLDDGARRELASQVRADAGALPARPSDTYYGGKALARDANLLDLADQLGLDDVAGPLRKDLAAALREWTQPHGCEERDARCFVHDPVLGSVVGRTPSFGSEQINDHHFHYGYFLYAAGVVAADDPGLADDLAPVMNLLAADVAAGAASDELPATRVFDPYLGHSWASGYGQFADGNNQESSSEAVSAWNGLALWARASGQDGLEAQARWMLGAEAASAKAYWTDFDASDPVYEGFAHHVTSLVWGGKRDWATWFSGDPSAMLGILVLPMSPVGGYLAGDPDRIRANLDEALAGDPGGYDVVFGDYLLMYAALAGPDDAASALKTARDLPDDRIDDGDTRSYLLAWLMVHAA